jgi:hypothetical protein
VLRYTPFADELLLDFVRSLVVQERLGQRDVPDLLAISFSAMDYIQHGWGVRSLESGGCETGTQLVFLAAVSDGGYVSACLFDGILRGK